MPEGSPAVSSAYASADLLLKLYDLRREAGLRQARHWFFFEFFPSSADEVFAVWTGGASAHFRMVTSYWEMAAALVRLGAIDKTMFYATNTEHVALIAKLGDFLPELRRRSGTPDYLGHIESVVREMPESAQALAVMRRYLQGRQSSSR